MQLRQTVTTADRESEFEVILHCAGPRAQGKYIVGRVAGLPGRLWVIFDDTAPFHKDIGAKYGVRPLGGGWCVLDESRRTLRLSSRSTQYGREPDRQTALAAFRAALPGYDCQEEG
jgi:hypothetical protein